MLWLLKSGEYEGLKIRDSRFEDEGNKDHFDQIGLGGSEVSAGEPESSFKALSTSPRCHPQYANSSADYQTHDGKMTRVTKVLMQTQQNLVEKAESSLTCISS